MKKLILGLLVVALCAAPASASSIGLFASYYSPEDTSAEGGLGVDMEFGDKVELEFRLTVYDYLLTDANPEVYRLQAVPFDVGVNYNFGSGKTVTPYVGGGLSYMTFEFDTDASQTTGQPRGAAASQEIEFYAQLGLDFEINSTWTASAEVVLRSLDTEVENDDLGFPIDQRVGLSGPAFNIGLAVQW